MILTDEFRIRINGQRCVYCGNSAESDDHYPPKSVSSHGMLLPCCRECNSSLGALHPFSFSNRCRLAKDSIRRKYKKVLNMPLWDEDEMEDLSYALKRSIIECEKVKSIINERLAWSAMSYLSSLDPERDFAAIVAECDLITGNVKRSWNRIDGFTVNDDEKEAKIFMKNFG